MSMCEGCDGHCCRLQVDLTSYDILRIASAGTGMQFVTVCEAGPDSAFAFRSGGKLVKFVLSQENGTCVFFSRDSPLRCSIQAMKPSICLLYPFSRDGSLRFDVCCVVRNLCMAEKQGLPAGFPEGYVWETARYREFVDDWNASARGTEPHDAFFSFAADEMRLESTPWGAAWRRVLRLFRKK